MKIDNNVLKKLQRVLITRCDKAILSLSAAENSQNCTIVSTLNVRLALSDLKSLISELEQEFKRESN